jgi:predicted DNA-binding transcriptional regulator AlpA
MINLPLHHPPKGCCFAIVVLEPPSFSDGSLQEHGVRTMPDPLAGLPPRFLRTPEAARFLSLSGRTLEKHRTFGTGPKYRKIGGRVVYALEDLKAWADLGAKTSTSDPGVGTVSPAKRRTPVISAGPGTRSR